MTEQVTEADLPHLRRCVELATEAAEAGDFSFGSVLGRAGTHRVRNLIGATGPLARRPGSQPGPGPALGDHGGGSRSGGGRAGPGSGGAGTRPAPQIPLSVAVQRRHIRVLASDPHGCRMPGGRMWPGAKSAAGPPPVTRPG